MEVTKMPDQAAYPIMAEGVIWCPKWVWFWHAPRAWAPRQAVFKLSCYEKLASRATI